MTWLLRLLGYIEEQPSISAAQRARREAMMDTDGFAWAEWDPIIAQRMRRELAPPKPMRRRRK
jgi:hypothetical protein